MDNNKQTNYNKLNKRSNINNKIINKTIKYCKHNKQ